MDELARSRVGAPAGDLALAAGLAAFSLIDVLLSSDWRGPTAVNAVVVPCLALSLTWRRVRPIGVLCVVVSGVVCLSLLFQSSETWSYVFITTVAVYSAAAHGSRPFVVLLLIGLAVAVSDLRDPEVHGFGDAVWSPTLLGLSFLAGLAGWGQQRRSSALTRRARLLEEEEEERARAAAAEERDRIARELHDIVSHSLAVMVVQAGAGEQTLDRDPEKARAALRSIRATGQEAVGQMSAMLELVRGEGPETREPQPSLADLDQLVAKTRDAGLPVRLIIEGERRPLPTAVEVSAYRIVQEGLTNALKHGEAAPTRVVLRYREDLLEVEVSNERGDGAPGPGARRGLAGIGERVAVFGGDLQAGPRDDGGWTMRAALPLGR